MEPRGISGEFVLVVRELVTSVLLRGFAVWGSAAVSAFFSGRVDFLAPELLCFGLDVCGSLSAAALRADMNDARVECDEIPMNSAMATTHNIVRSSADSHATHTQTTKTTRSPTNSCMFPGGVFFFHDIQTEL